MWEHLFRLAQVGMNHYGGAHFRHSGEGRVLTLVAEQGAQAFGNVLLDVGANTGDYACMALDLTGDRYHIHCFEPAASSRSLLTERLSEQIAQGRVTIVPKGVGKEAGELTLYSPKPGSSVASLYRFDPATRPWEGNTEETIRIVTVDDHCAQHAIARVLMLKIDVEGHELAVLQGASNMLARKAIQYIQFEFGEAHIDARTFFLDFHKLLSPNYELYRILPDGLRHITTYTPDLEVFHTTNYLAVLRSPERRQPL